MDINTISIYCAALTMNTCRYHICFFFLQWILKTIEITQIRSQPFTTIQIVYSTFSPSAIRVQCGTFAAQGCPPLCLLNGESPSGKTGAPSLHQLVPSAGTPHVLQPSNADLLSHFLHHDALKAQNRTSTTQLTSQMKLHRRAAGLANQKLWLFPIMLKSKGWQRPQNCCSQVPSLQSSSTCSCLRTADQARKHMVPVSANRVGLLDKPPTGT